MLKRAHSNQLGPQDLITCLKVSCDFYTEDKILNKRRQMTSKGMTTPRENLQMWVTAHHLCDRKVANEPKRKQHADLFQHPHMADPPLHVTCRCRSW